jgi:transcriptional regulator NrdR family protein
VTETRDHDIGQGWPLPGVSGTLRRRQCNNCDARFKTVEIAVDNLPRLTTPSADRAARIAAMEAVAAEMSARAGALRSIDRRETAGGDA